MKLACIWQLLKYVYNIGPCHVSGNFLPFKGKSPFLSSQAARFLPAAINEVDGLRHWNDNSPPSLPPLPPLRQFVIFLNFFSKLFFKHFFELFFELFLLCKREKIPFAKARAIEGGPGGLSNCNYTFYLMDPMWTPRSP
jgi:hypothetical protein